MTVLDLPFNLVEQMLNQASTGEQLLGILEAVTTPDPSQVNPPRPHWDPTDEPDDVTEEDEDLEPSDTELDELRPEVVTAILETEVFDPEIIEQELQNWDNTPDEAFYNL